MPALLVCLLLTLPSSVHTVATSGWAWPLAGQPVVDRPFTPPQTSYGAGHRGVDLRAPVGTPVLAAGAGTVTYVGLLAGRGVVTVSHAGGLRTTYEPVAGTVRRGQVVLLGTRIGTVTVGHPSCRLGTTCLHWGLLRGSTYLDPLSLVGATRLRLLPLGPIFPGDRDVRTSPPGPPVTHRAAPVSAPRLSTARPGRAKGATSAPAIVGAGLVGVGVVGASVVGAGLVGSVTAVNRRRRRRRG